MTYPEAKKWLAKIGGERVDATEQVAGKGSIIVTVRSAKNGTVSRQWLFDDRLAGYDREIGIQHAFVQACEELKRALA